jgi:hypothetical protein
LVHTSTTNTKPSHMPLGHGLDVAASAIPNPTEPFQTAGARSKERDKYNKDKLMLSLLSSMVLDSAYKNNDVDNFLDAAGTFIEQLFSGQSIEESFAKATETYNTPSYEEFSKVDFGADADFDKAVEFVLEREGLLSNHSSDRGGLTKYGISQKANPDIDIANLTREDAIAIYKERYWDSVGAGNMDMATALVAFDASVNHGVGTAKRMIAESNGDVGAMLDWRLNYYDKIVDRDTSQSVFLAGWNNRIGHLQDAVSSIYNKDDNDNVVVAAAPNTTAPALI